MWEYLKTVNKPILLYGMGNGAEKIMKELERRGIKVSGVFASDGFVRGHKFKGFDVMSYSVAKQQFGDMIVLLCFGSQLPNVLKTIRSVADEQELYAPDVPVFGSEIFDRDYARLHKDDLTKVYNLLADDTSKKVFENIIKYKITGKIDYLFECQTEIDDAYNILNLGDNEIYMDLGAYRGDTITEFLLHVNGFNHIYGVEPDPKNFRHLINNTEGLENCTCLNLGVSDKEEQLCFSAKSGRNSSVSSGGNLIDMDSVDNIMAGKPATYIKMDVEGQESKAILGAKNTILNYKPKMLISCYHRTEDIFDLPLRVMSIRDDYKIYMRHYPYVPAWDTNFYFV